MPLYGTGQNWGTPAAPTRDYDAARRTYKPAIVSAFAAGATAGGSTAARPAYKNIPLDFSSPGTTTYEVPGRFIWFHEWSQLTGVFFWVRFNDPGADRIIMRPGKAFPVPFERIIIQLPTYAGVTGELLILPDVPDVAQLERGSR
jgi:hypothetical protein